MNFVLYGKIPVINDFYYLIREDGHIFDFNFETFKWADASERVCFDGTWDIFETSQQFDHSMVDSYEERSENYNFFELNYLDTHPSFSWGNAIVYYKKDGKIRGRDEFKNEYECNVPYMLISEEKLIDDTWTKIRRLDVIFEVGKFREIVNIAHLDLYKDTDGNLRAFSKDGKEYRVSKETGDACQILDTKGVIPEYKPVNESFLVKFTDQKPELFLTWLDLSNMKNMDKYLLNSKKILKEKYNITLGNDLWYFNNGWGDIYACDDNDKEYHVLPNSLVPIEKGTINFKKWEQIHHLLALEYAKFYKRRVKALNEENPNVLAVDLKLYKNDDDEFFGFDEKGNYYDLGEDGIFNKTNDKIENKGFDEYECQTYEAVINQGLITANYCFSCYMNLCYEHLSDKEKKELGNNISLFVKMNPGERTIIFAKDDKGHEYKCNMCSLEKVRKGTIKYTYKQIEIRQFLFYINLIRIEEENPELFVD